MQSILRTEKLFLFLLCSHKNIISPSPLKSYEKNKSTWMGQEYGLKNHTLTQAEYFRFSDFAPRNQIEQNNRINVSCVLLTRITHVSLRVAYLCGIAAPQDRFVLYC